MASAARVRAPVTPAPCVLAVAEHTGWAHVTSVAVAGGVPVVVSRRRVTILDAGLPPQPYEHDSMGMREDDANALIARVRRSANARSLQALQRLVAELTPAHRVLAITIRKPQVTALPASVTTVWESHRLRYHADGLLFQLALCRAARQLGLGVDECRRGDESARAADALGVTAAAIEAFVTTSGRPAGPPWTQEHRRGFAAAIAILANHVRPISLG